mgnify:CR=1 FL=1
MRRFLFFKINKLYVDRRAAGSTPEIGAVNKMAERSQKYGSDGGFCCIFLWRVL